MIIANLMQNAKTAQQVIATAVEQLAVRPHLRVRARRWHALITRPEAVSDEAKRRLPPWSADTCERPDYRIEHVTIHPCMSIVVTGSIAYDYLMSFPGKFTEHFLPEHMTGSA